MAGAQSVELLPAGHGGPVEQLWRAPLCGYRTSLHCPTSSSISSLFDSSVSHNNLEKKQSNTMRLSCNGCLVLQKGCTETCTIRPCLQWIKAPDAQANATVFLAKFYGRAGLLNLIDAAPSDELRPAVFRSLLYEACGRIVNPIYGSVGLLWSGSWHLYQAAVEAVLKGAPIVQISADEAAAAAPGPESSWLSLPSSSSPRPALAPAPPAGAAHAGAPPGAGEPRW